MPLAIDLELLDTTFGRDNPYLVAVAPIDNEPETATIQVFEVDFNDGWRGAPISAAVTGQRKTCVVLALLAEFHSPADYEGIDESIKYDIDEISAVDEDLVAELLARLIAAMHPDIDTPRHVDTG